MHVAADRLPGEALIRQVQLVATGAGRGVNGETGALLHRKGKAMRKILATAALTGLALVPAAMSATAFAASSDASACGAAHGAFANENGNFGFLGALGGTPGYHNGAVGQESGATGSNNSHTGCQG